MRCSPFFLALIGFSSLCGGVTTDGPPTSDTESLEILPTSSARKLPSHDVGLPSELAWQAWLVVANKPDAQSSFESATVPRRISPKSVFVAPPLTLPACADGYVADSMGRCVKDTIKIDGYSHLKFVLERLNARFAANKVALDDSAAVGTEQKESAASGPLQVNISLGIDSNRNSESGDTTEGSSDREENPDSDADREDPVEISVVQVSPTGSSSEVNGAETEASLTLYKVVNGTKMHLGDEDKGMYLRVNTSGDILVSPIREIVVPVAELLEDGNQSSSFGDVVDYEIPTSLGSLFNVTSVNNITKKVQASLPPTVVLLLSPTKGTTSIASSGSDVTGKLDSKLAASVTENSEGKLEAQDGGGSDFLSDGKVVEGKPLDNEQDEKEKEELIEVNEELEDTSPGTSETSLTTEYPEEDEVDTTDWNDEILAHSEAGMLISAPGAGIGSSSFEGKTEAGRISSESSIRGDVIVETTLLDLNTGSVTEAPSPQDEKVQNFHELLVSDEENARQEPEVVFSPRIENRRRTTAHREEERKTNVDDSSALDSYLKSHASMRYVASLEEEGRNDPPQRSRTPATSSSGHDYVRFPDDNTRRSSSSYVHFPSDQSANSINSNLDNSRERKPYSEESSRSPHNSVPVANEAVVNQKRTYWQLPPGWRIDDLQPPPQPITVQKNGALDNPQRQNPMLLRFWTRMPLFRDPSLQAANSHSSRRASSRPSFSSSPSSTSSSSSSSSPSSYQRTGNFHRKSPTQTVDRLLTQKNHQGIGQLIHG